MLGLIRQALASENPAIKRTRSAIRSLPGAASVAQALRSRLAPPAPEPAPPTIPPKFAARLAQHLEIADVRTEQDPVKRMWIDFALSTVSRGENARGELARFRPLQGKRYLDVGCAYGGFLVAFAKAGAAPTGIEISRPLIECAHALLSDYGVDAPIHSMDLLDRKAIGALGTFDLVTCNDVIEHVADPRAGLESLVSLLSSDGLLYMEIPNRFYARYLEADGHFQRFGITALPKPSADRYYKLFYPEKQHDVTYRSLAFYRNALAAMGARTTLLNPPGVQKREKLAEIAGALESCERKSREIALPASPVSTEAIARVRRLARIFDEQHARWARLEKRNPAKADALADRLILTFGVDFWRLLVHKA